MKLRFPGIVWIVPTDRCNTRCRTCSHFYTQSGKDMSEEIFSKIEQEVLDHVWRVHLIGGGEPLISKIFPQMLEACIKRKIKIFFITNTKALTKELTHLLVKNHAEIMVSLDGATAQTFNHVRPFIKFESVLDKFEMIKSIRSQYPGNQFKLTTNTVVMKSNLHELFDIIELADEFKIDRTYFTELTPLPSIKDNFFVEEIPSNSPELIKKYIPKAIARARELGVNYKMQNAYLDMLHDGVDRPLNLNKANAVNYAPKSCIFPNKCHFPWTYAQFMVNGNVTPCCNNSMVLGNLNTETFEQIWNGNRYDILRRTINTNNPPSQCRNCNLAEGIAAGDTSFFSNFCKQNLQKSFTHNNLKFSNQAYNWTVEIETKKAEFLMVTVKISKGVTGVVRYGEAEIKIYDNSSKILLPIDKKYQNTTLSFAFDFTGPIEFKKFDLLSYDYKAIKQDDISNGLIDKKYNGHAQRIHDHLLNKIKTKSALKTFMVFGANHIGKLIQKDAMAQGLIFLGFIDNYMPYFDDSPVFTPETLMNMCPDIILIASKAHAMEIKRQIKEIINYHPAIIHSST